MSQRLGVLGGVLVISLLLGCVSASDLAQSSRNGGGAGSVPVAVPNATNVATWPVSDYRQCLERALLTD